MTLASRPRRDRPSKLACAGRVERTLQTVSSSPPLPSEPDARLREEAAESNLTREELAAPAGEGSISERPARTAGGPITDAP